MKGLHKQNMWREGAGIAGNNLRAPAIAEARRGTCLLLPRSKPLITGCPSYCWYCCGAATFGALETKLSGLTRLQSTIPAQVTGAVGIAAGQVGIPAVGDP